MKLASIITMHFPCNYGAVLQAYALSNYLKEKGLQAIIIDYIPEYFKEKNSIWYVGNPKYKRNPIIRFLYLTYMVPLRLRRKLSFAKFRNNELNMSSQMTKEDLLDGKLSDADVYFCGSDQIWNEKNETIFDPIYYLQFVKEPCKRFSYAASGTISYPFSEKMNSTVLPWINDLSGISVREDILKENLEKELCKHIEHVCDPVFLLSPQQWLSLAKKGAKAPQMSYVLVYSIGDDSAPYIRAREIADQKQLPVFSISWFGNKSADLNIKCNPYEFIMYFKEANFIVTNSFHGTAFSLIFRRQFWACETKIANHRLISILRSVGLCDRLLTPIDKIDFDKSIQWNCVYERLDEYINHSKNYIQNCIRI